MSAPNTIPLTYNSFVAQIANMAVENVFANGSGVLIGSTYFNTLIPQALQYAELRIQRDLDLNASQTLNSYTLTAGSSALVIPANDFVTIQDIIVTANSQSVPLLPVSKEFLQNVYGLGSTLGTPTYFAVNGGDLATGGNTSNNFLVGPIPDINYPLSVTGTIRMPTLYATAATNGLGTTWISTNLPDLLIQGGMIFVSQYQRNFGASSSDPEMAGNFENQYQTLLKGALVEEARRKFRSTNWNSMSPALIAGA